MGVGSPVVCMPAAGFGCAKVGAPLSADVEVCGTLLSVNRGFGTP